MLYKVMLYKKAFLLALISFGAQFNSNAAEAGADNSTAREDENSEEFDILIDILKNISGSIDTVRRNNPGLRARIGSPRVVGIDTGQGLTSSGLVLVLSTIRGKTLPVELLTPWGKVPLIQDNNLTPESSDFIVKSLLDSYNYRSFSSDSSEDLPVRYSQAKLYSILGPKNGDIVLSPAYSVQAHLPFGHEYREIALDWGRLLRAWQERDPGEHANLFAHGFLDVPRY